ncbi:MAG: FKBP-type peptidyl-prolyl cis-trans isomerase [Bacteroidota bacterium]
MQTSKNIAKYTFLLLGSLLLFNSCKKEYESIESIDDAKIQAYIQENNINAIKDPSGFYYQVIEQGTGGPLLNKDSIFYNSTIKSLTGTTYYAPKDFSNDGNYLGYITPTSYRIALYHINRGGKVRVIMPSYLAFGKNGSGPIPGNEVVTADISVYPQTTQWELDDKVITDFLTAKGLTATKHPSRVYYNISQAGTGTTAIEASSTVTVKYTGRLLTGTVFDKTADGATYEAVLAQQIVSWRKVLIGLTKGTKLRIFTPSDLSYGPLGRDAIPPNSVLDFDIEIVEVVN